MTSVLFRWNHCTTRYDMRIPRFFQAAFAQASVSVLGFEDYHLRLRQVLASGGVFPVSVAVHGDLLYVLNAHEAAAVTGYRITDGEFCPIQGSTRALELTPVTGPGQFVNTPGQIGFTPDGRQLVITTKRNGSLIDVFVMGTDGRPSETFVANPAGVPIPFGFTFDDNNNLVVTDAATSTLSTYSIRSDGKIDPIASQPDGGLLCAGLCTRQEISMLLTMVAAPSPDTTLIQRGRLPCLLR
jgi:hypothetical protein